MKPRTVTVENRMSSATAWLREFEPRRPQTCLSMPALVYECCRT